MNKTILLTGNDQDLLNWGYVGIKVFNLVIKKIKDAEMYLICSFSNYKIKFLEDIISTYDLQYKIKLIDSSSNIKEYLFKSTLLLQTSLYDDFPLMVNLAKGYRIPILAFDSLYNNEYKNGVYLVNALNVEEMANIVINILKTEAYRKVGGIRAKLSIREESNINIINMWNKLFIILEKNDRIAYHKLRKLSYEKYYNEDEDR